MKNYIFPTLALAVAVCACSIDEPNLSIGEQGGEVTITLNAALPSNIVTKSASDGSGATILTYSVLDSDGAPVILKATAKVENYQSNITLSLLKDQSYDIVLWADGDDSPYSISDDGKSVTIDYSDAACNDEGYDAFYAHCNYPKDAVGSEISVTLYRPLAQLNYGTNDLSVISALGLDAEGYTYSITLAGSFPTSLDLLEDKVSGSESELSFTVEGLPGSDATFNVEGYDYLAYAYVLVGVEDQTSMVATSAKLDITGEGIDPIEVMAYNVPFSQNYRTNIYGSLFTNPVDVTVEINAEWGEPDTDIFLPSGVNLGLSSGTIWANCNVGATDVTDSGNVYSLANSALALNLWANSCSGSWALPTAEQIYELEDECSWEWSEEGSYYTATGPNGNSIILPLTANAEYGNYLSSGEYSTGGVYALDFTSSKTPSLSVASSSNELSVRLVQSSNNE